jgi:hypothetical protein
MSFRLSSLAVQGDQPGKEWNEDMHVKFRSSVDSKAVSFHYCRHVRPYPDPHANGTDEDLWKV